MATGDLLSSLDALQAQFDHSGNQLTVLPDTITALTTLTTLDLAGNRLTQLPRGLGGLPWLTHLTVSGNALPPEVEASDAEGSEAEQL